MQISGQRLERYKSSLSISLVIHRCPEMWTGIGCRMDLFGLDKISTDWRWTPCRAARKENDIRLRRISEKSGSEKIATRRNSDNSLTTILGEFFYHEDSTTGKGCAALIRWSMILPKDKTLGSTSVDKSDHTWRGLGVRCKFKRPEQLAGKGFGSAQQCLSSDLMGERTFFWVWRLRGSKISWPRGSVTKDRTIVVAGLMEMPLSSSFGWRWNQIIGKGQCELWRWSHCLVTTGSERCGENKPSCATRRQPFFLAREMIFGSIRPE